MNITDGEGDAVTNPSAHILDAPEIVRLRAELDRLREDLAVNAQMLARQCDLARQAEHECYRLEAEVGRLKAELMECPTCGGTGAMEVCVGVLPPDGQEITEFETCAECGGNGKSGYARLAAELDRMAVFCPTHARDYTITYGSHDTVSPPPREYARLRAEAAMTKDEALAWASKTMNARLREARQTGNDHDYDEAMESCIDTLSARVRELEGRTCETCAYTMRYREDESPNCTNIPGNYDCGVFGNTCGAWRKKP